MQARRSVLELDPTLSCLHYSPPVAISSTTEISCLRCLLNCRKIGPIDYPFIPDNEPSERGDCNTTDAPKLIIFAICPLGDHLLEC